MADILLVEDEVNARQVLSIGLETQGHRVCPCSGPDEARLALQQQTFDLVLTDLRMEGRDAGLEVVDMAAACQPQPRILLITAYASTETAVDAMRLGAFDYLTKPVSMDELQEAVERALHSEQADSSSNEPEPAETSDAGLLIGASAVMQRVRERLQRAAKRDFTVLITGESGTGKEVAARFVHLHSPRREQAFIPVHCAAIPEGLFESELFGHCKGAFTSADTDRKGLVEAANGGTLFLDEIGEMPLNIQVKLLRLLQEHSFRRVGEDRERRADVRILAATNRDLIAEVREGSFREDLFYRLNVVPVHMPALRQRREDIPLLVTALLQRMGETTVVDDETLAQLAQLPLKGNVRELENLLQRLLALSDGDKLDISILDDFDDLYPEEEQSLENISLGNGNLDDALEGVERRLIEQAMERTKQNATLAAKELGITFRSIRYRLKKLGIKD
jgi:DNA-binding NtrC family response regulator